MINQRFEIGERVCKVKGSSWRGCIVGYYSTALTPVGYCVESENEPGSVQIYPASALEFMDQKASDNTENPHIDWPARAEKVEDELDEAKRQHVAALTAKLRAEIALTFARALLREAGDMLKAFSDESAGTFSLARASDLSSKIREFLK
jgi:acyl-CoA reductase-like NAD-dependent aldehyde dehydrogenase